MHIIGRLRRPTSHPTSAILRSLTLLAAALAVSISPAAHATTIGHFDFSGTINNQNFYGPLPAFLTNVGVAVGDHIDVQFDLVSVYTSNGFYWPGAAQNIVVTDTTRNAIIAQQTSAAFETYPGFGGSPGDYRWDTAIPGESPFEMTLWFRTTDRTLIKQDVLPTTIDASQFDYLHDFIIYYENGQNPTVLDAELSNIKPAVAPSAVPEPTTLSMFALSLSSLLTRRGRNLFRRR